MPERDQVAAQSHLLPLARAIDESMARCRAEFARNGLLGDAISETLMDQRAQLAASIPRNAVDALVMVASAQALGLAFCRSDLDELGPHAIHLGVNELVSALEGVRGFLEGEAGTTAKALGLDPEGTRWQ